MLSAGAEPLARLLPENASIQIADGDRRVGTIVSSDNAFATNSFWVEGADGLIMIDTQFLLSCAQDAIDWAEKATGKKVVLAVILHPNPDKFNGTEVFQKHGVKVITSQQVIDLIPSVHADRLESFYDRYKPDYPQNAPKPESFGSKTCDISAAGITIKCHVLGAGCSKAHVIVQYEDHVFVGDLVANLHHSWLEIGATDKWLRRLAEIRALDPEYVHPGRGPSGGKELLDREESYLKHVIALVQREHPELHRSQKISQAALARLSKQLEADYPGYGNTFFLQIGLPAEWKRQQAATSHKP